MRAVDPGCGEALETGDAKRRHDGLHLSPCWRRWLEYGRRGLAPRGRKNAWTVSPEILTAVRTSIAVITAAHNSNFGIRRQRPIAEPAKSVDMIEISDITYNGYNTSHRIKRVPWFVVKATIGRQVCTHGNRTFTTTSHLTKACDTARSTS